MKQYLLLLFITVCLTGKTTTFTVTNSGNTFSPASLTIAVGDTVRFILTSSHDAREVSQTTWNSNGTTSLTGGFQTAFGGGTVFPVHLTLGTHYYVCTPHAWLGMKGTITVVSCLPPPQPGTISGPSVVCAGVPVNYSIAPVNGATNYSWTLPGGWSGTSTTNTISVTTNTAGGTMSVAATSTCGASGERTLSVTVFTSVPSAPLSLTGNTNVCSGSFNQYQASATAGAQSYSWTLPSGWLGTSQLSAIGTVAGSIGGMISVQAANVCGLSAPQTLSVSVTSGTALPAPASVSGNTLICAGTLQQYSVTPVSGATSYSWSFPGGFTGASGNNTVNAVTSGTSSGLISVTANNICGASPPQSISVTVSPALPAAPSPILGNTVLCSGTQSTFSVGAVPSALSYSWSLPSGWSGTSTTNVLNFIPGQSTGSLYVWAINACGDSPMNLLVPVVSTAVPAPGPINGNTLVCPYSAVGYSIPAVPGALEYMWIVPGDWSGGSGTNFFGGSVKETGGNIEVHVSNGCGMGMQLLAVTVHTFDPQISTFATNSLSAIPADAEAYQWLDCNNGLQAVTGQTLSAIGISSDVNYAVAITQFGCTDTSDCFDLVFDGIASQYHTRFLEIFPNPAADIVILRHAPVAARFEITNVLGEIVLFGQLRKEETTIDVSALAPGLYLVKVADKGFTATLIKN